MDNKKFSSYEKIHELIEDEANKWINGEIKMMAPMASAAINNDTDIIKYATAKYQNDKKEYLKTGNWPEVMFYRRDMLWSYYYYLQLTDMNVNLEKYLDFDYDTNKWNRSKLISAVHQYGLNALFQIRLYSDQDSNLSFDDYMRNKMKVELERIEQREKFNQFLSDHTSKMK